MRPAGPDPGFALFAHRDHSRAQHPPRPGPYLRSDTWHVRRGRSPAQAPPPPLPGHSRRRPPCPCHSSRRRSRGVLPRPTVGCRPPPAQRVARCPGTFWVDALSTSRRADASVCNVRLRRLPQTSFPLRVPPCSGLRDHTCLARRPDKPLIGLVRVLYGASPSATITAFPSASCPVTTRRMCHVIVSLPPDTLQKPGPC